MRRRRGVRAPACLTISAKRESKLWERITEALSTRAAALSGRSRPTTRPLADFFEVARKSRVRTSPLSQGSKQAHYLCGDSSRLVKTTCLFK
jgi:hypothetical protein